MEKRKVGNPKLKEVSKKTQVKKGEVRNPNGRPKRADLVGTALEIFNNIHKVLMPRSQVANILESIPYMTMEQLRVVDKIDNLPHFIKLEIETLLRGFDDSSERVQVKDKILILERTEKKIKYVASGSELPPVPIVNLNIYAEKAQQNDD